MHCTSRNTHPPRKIVSKHYCGGTVERQICHIEEHIRSAPCYSGTKRFASERYSYTRLSEHPLLRTLSLVPKLASYIYLHNESLFSGQVDADNKMILFWSTVNNLY